MKKTLLSLLAALVVLPSLHAAKKQTDNYKDYLKIFYKNVSSNDLMGYVEELSKEEYEGRLVGTKGMQKAVDWSIDLFEDWGVKPFGVDGTYIQPFPHIYSEISDADVKIHIPVGDNKSGKDFVTKSYPWSEWYAGSLSADGEITAEIVYAGYGIIAPELGYNDYEGIDVKGKIVLIAGETPFRNSSAEDILKWHDHTLHQTKHRNAVEQGAIGMLYNWVAGPNSSYDENFVYCHVTSPIVNDIFVGTGKTYKETIKKIRETKKPSSFNTGKKATIKVSAIHNPNGVGKNVVGIIEGTDPVLKDEYIIVGAHMDHLGMIPHLISGSNDNISATAALLATAKAISQGKIDTKRSIIFMHIDAEEANLGGSTFYCNNPLVPKEKVAAIINLESVGVGSSISVSAGVETPFFANYFKELNEKYIGRNLSTGSSRHLTRPRTDGAVFMKHGYPTVDVGSRGVGPGGKRYYHHPGDNITQITPDLMYDISKLVFLTTIKLANEEKIVLK